MKIRPLDIGLLAYLLVGSFLTFGLGLLGATEVDNDLSVLRVYVALLVTFGLIYIYVKNTLWRLYRRLRPNSRIPAFLPEVKGSMKQIITGALFIACMAGAFFRIDWQIGGLTEDDLIRLAPILIITAAPLLVYIIAFFWRGLSRYFITPT